MIVAYMLNVSLQKIFNTPSISKMPTAFHAFLLVSSDGSQSALLGAHIVHLPASTQKSGVQRSGVQVFLPIIILQSPALRWTFARIR